MAGKEKDEPDDPKVTGKTIAKWVVANRGGFRGPQGLPMYKPPYSRITAIDMNTGKHLWYIPNGDTPEYIKNHKALRGVDVPTTGATSLPVTLITKSLLVHAEGSRGEPVLRAVDKKTGKRLGTVDLPAHGQYGMMTYQHDGKQYIVVQIMGPTYPGALAALRLP